MDYNVSKARLLHSLAKCLLELGQRFARIFCEDLVVMALAIRFLRCHLPVVTGFRSLISSSHAGINFILPTCQVSFYVFDGNYILWYKLLFFLNFILATIGNNWTLFKIVAEMEDRLKPRCGEARGLGGGGGDLNNKSMVMLVRNFKENPQEVSSSWLVDVAGGVFHP